LNIRYIRIKNSLDFFVYWAVSYQRPLPLGTFWYVSGWFAMERDGLRWFAINCDDLRWLLQTIQALIQKTNLKQTYHCTQKNQSSYRLH